MMKHTIILMLMLSGIAYAYDYSFTCADPYFVCGSFNNTCSDPTYGVYLIGNVFQATKSGTYGLDVQGFVNSNCGGINVTASGVEITNTCNPATPGGCGGGASYPSTITVNGNSNFVAHGVDSQLLLVNKNGGSYSAISFKIYGSSGATIDGGNTQTASPVTIVNSTSITVQNGLWGDGGGGNSFSVTGGSGITLTNDNFGTSSSGMGVTFSDTSSITFNNVTSQKDYGGAPNSVTFSINGGYTSSISNSSLMIINYVNHTNGAFADSYSPSMSATTSDLISITRSTVNSLTAINSSVSGSDSNIPILGINGATAFNNIFTNTNSSAIYVWNAAASFTGGIINGYVSTINSHGSTFNFAGGSQVNSPTFTTSSNIVFNPNCTADNTQLFTSLCGSGALTLTNTSSSTLSHFVYSSIVLDGSDSNIFDPIAFGTLSLTNSDSNRFTGAGANNSSYINHVAGANFVNSSSNIIEKMSLGTTTYSGGSCKYRSYVIDAGSHSNTIRNNYFKENYENSGCPGEYTIRIENGSLSNQINGNIFDMDNFGGGVIGDLNPYSEVVDYNGADANAYRKTMTGTKNISGSVLAMSYPFSLYYGSVGSDYPYNTNTSSGDLYNIQDTRPLTNNSFTENTTGNLTISIIQPTFGEQVEGLTFTTLYSIVNGSNTHGCYLAAKPSTYEYYPYQHSINCSGSSDTTTVSEYGEYNLVVGAYDDSGGLVATTTFEMVNTTPVPPINVTPTPTPGPGPNNDNNCLNFGIGCPNNNNVTNQSNNDCIPFLTCPNDKNVTPDLQCISGVNCPWDAKCANSSSTEGCAIINNDILKGTIPWIASLSAGASTAVFNSLVFIDKIWWLLVLVLLAYSGEKVLKGKESIGAAVAFALAVTVVIIFI